MNFFPAPFTLGTSPIGSNGVVSTPVDVHILDSDKPSLVCRFGNVLYTNQMESSMVDSNFSTIIFNKKTKELSIIHKTPEFLGPHFDEAGSPTSSNIGKVDRSALTSTFGMAKRQRLLKDLERNISQETAATNVAVLHRAVLGQARVKLESDNNESLIDIKPSSTNANISERRRLLPPVNVNAASPRDVYPLDQLVPLHILDPLTSEADRLNGIKSLDNWPDKDSLPKYVLSHLPCGPLAINNALYHRFGGPLKYLTYVTLIWHMFTLFNLNTRDLQRRQPLPNCPSLVSRYLLDNFTILINRSSTGRMKVRTISPTLRDKLIYHILVLILHCDNFNVIVDDLIDDFKLGCERLKRYLNYLGCKFVKMDHNENEQTVVQTRATLVTPVRFPTSLHSRLRQ